MKKIEFFMIATVIFIMQVVLRNISEETNIHPFIGFILLSIMLSFCIVKKEEDK